MIIGVGTDVIEISRIRDSIEKFGDRFISKIFTEAEIAYCSSKADPALHYSGRFAVKEAVVKALSHVYKGAFIFPEIEVLNESDGIPKVFLKGRLEGVLTGKMVIHVSLSHSLTVASGIAVISSD
ncbi:MAG: holo-ACP synthase [Ignavibacteriaceae bacterium]|nr:holo-ACP synthase [Ignavibacteriaceae bacterium]